MKWNVNEWKRKIFYRLGFRFLNIESYFRGHNISVWNYCTMKTIIGVVAGAFGWLIEIRILAYLVACDQFMKPKVSKCEASFLFNILEAQFNILGY